MYTVSKEDNRFNLWLLLLKTRRVLYRARERELAQYDITPEQGEILFINRVKKGNINQTEIARLMAREPHTIGGIIKRMEKKGFVKRNEDPKLKNAKRITITNRGKQVMEKVDSRVTINNVMSALTDRESSQLWYLLEKLLNSGIRELDKYYVSPYTKIK
jgi:DNA-binding MarR family transcriptional regulator